MGGEADKNGCPTAGYCANHKIVGDSWTNEGVCEGNPGHPDCGPETQTQTRECTDGTIDLCTAEDTTRVVSCAIAKTALPACKASTCEGNEIVVAVYVNELHDKIYLTFFLVKLLSHL